MALLQLLLGAKSATATELRLLLRVTDESIANLKKYHDELYEHLHNTKLTMMPQEFYHVGHTTSVRDDYGIHEDFVKLLGFTTDGSGGYDYDIGTFYHDTLEDAARALRERYFISFHIYESIYAKDIDAETKVVLTAGQTFNASVYYVFDERRNNTQETFYGGASAKVTMMHQTVGYISKSKDNVELSILLIR